MSRFRFFVLLAIAFVLGAGLPTAANSQAVSARVTYIGNEGFFLSTGGAGVLVDALVRRGIRPYVKANAHDREQLELAQGPFDQVTLVLATHHHADHFDAQAVRSHLERNPNAVFVSTAQAVELVLETGPGAAALGTRLIAVQPEEGTVERLSFPGVELDVFNLHHGRDRQPVVENLGFLVDVEGLRFLHVGDTEATRDELMALALGGLEIDVAFIPYWKLLWGEPGFVEDAIGSARVAAMHIPSARAQSDYFGEFEDLDGLVGGLEEAYPGILVFVEPTDTRTITR